MTKIAAVTFGYGSIASSESLIQRGLNPNEIKIIPVLNTSTDKLYRGYGIPAGTGLEADLPQKRRTLGIYESQQLPSGLFVPYSYELSGVVVPMTQNELDKLTDSENFSAGEEPMYTRGTLPADSIQAFSSKDKELLEGLLEGHEQVVFYKPFSEYESPTKNAGVPLSYIGVVMHGALQIWEDFARHMLDNTLDLIHVVDDVSQGDPSKFLYSKARTGDQFSPEDIKFIKQYLSAYQIDQTILE